MRDFIITNQNRKETPGVSNFALQHFALSKSQKFSFQIKIEKKL